MGGLSCSTQLRMKFKLFIKTKMLESRIFHAYRLSCLARWQMLKYKKLAFNIYEHKRCHARFLNKHLIEYTVCDLGV